MVDKTPIICPSCNTHNGNYEDYMRDSFETRYYLRKVRYDLDPCVPSYLLKKGGEMEVKVGDPVIHEGKEKTISEIIRDVIVLNDRKAVSLRDISPIIKKGRKSREAAPEAGTAEGSADKATLREAIEHLAQDTPVATVMNVMHDIDPAMVINTRIDWELFKRDIIHRALELRKIDPKICETCGQIIHE